MSDRDFETVQAGAVGYYGATAGAAMHGIWTARGRIEAFRGRRVVCGIMLPDFVT